MKGNVVEEHNFYYFFILLLPIFLFLVLALVWEKALNFMCTLSVVIGPGSCWFARETDTSVFSIFSCAHVCTHLRIFLCASWILYYCKARVCRIQGKRKYEFFYEKYTWNIFSTWESEYGKRVQIMSSRASWNLLDDEFDSGLLFGTF